MTAFQIISIVVAISLPIIFVIGFYVAVKVDIAKLQVKVDDIEKWITRVNGKLDKIVDKIINS